MQCSIGMMVNDTIYAVVGFKILRRKFAEGLFAFPNHSNVHGWRKALGNSRNMDSTNHNLDSWISFLNKLSVPDGKRIVFSDAGHSYNVRIEFAECILV